MAARRQQFVGEVGDGGGVAAVFRAACELDDGRVVGVVVRLVAYQLARTPGRCVR